MEVKSIYKLVPEDKFDIRSIEKLLQLNKEEISIIFPELFQWIADYNWPVAPEISRVLVKYPDILMPLIQKSLREEESDNVLKYWLIVKIIPELPVEYQEILKGAIARICEYPTDIERCEEVVDVTKEYMQGCCG